MAAEQLGGAVEGAKAGATIGTAIAPGFGTAVGAVIGGVVGLIGGIFSNKKKKAAKRAAREEANIRRQSQAAQIGLQRRDMVREARVARARAVAAGSSEERVMGSGTTGAASSVSAQLNFGLSYFDDQVINDYNANELRKKAGKFAGQASDINTALGSLGSIGTLGANIIGALKQPPTSTLPTRPGATPPFVGPR
jgi:hypothetical protein